MRVRGLGVVASPSRSWTSFQDGPAIIEDDHGRDGETRTATRGGGVRPHRRARQLDTPGQRVARGSGHLLADHCGHLPSGSYAPTRAKRLNLDACRLCGAHSGPQPNFCGSPHSCGDFSCGSASPQVRSVIAQRERAPGHPRRSAPASCRRSPRWRSTPPRRRVAARRSPSASHR